MTEIPKRIDYFNKLVGLIFAQLYENFPIAQHLDEAALADAMGVEATASPGIDPPVYDFGKLPNGDAFYLVLISANDWLEKEGFVRMDTMFGQSEPVLTAKALAVMNATPSGISGGKPLGAQLSDAAKGAGRSASNAAISDLVGQAIGMAAGFAKGLI